MPLTHVSDQPNGLPSHVEAQRTRVSVQGDAPRHTNTVEYAGAYAASGVDNSFSMARFREQFRVEVQSLDDEEIVFDMVGIDAAIANALRRILIAEVPTMAIEKVFILNNTSMIQDEVLAHRLGLVPILADPRLFVELPDGENARSDEHNVITFRLEVKCERRRAESSAVVPAGASAAGAGPSGAGASGSGGGGGGEASGGGASGDDLINGKVYTSQLQWIPQGDQEERFKEAPIRPVHGDILLAKLRPGQEIQVEAWCTKGVGKVHAKWSPVATATYRLLPEVRVAPAAAADAAANAGAPPPPSAFDAPPPPAPAAGADAAPAAAPAPRAARPRPCTMRRPCAKDPKWAERVALDRIKDHFIFTIESTGMLPPEVLFQEALKILCEKAGEVSARLKDATT